MDLQPEFRAWIQCAPQARFDTSKYWGTGEFEGASRGRNYPVESGTHSLRVLIVDDERIIADSLALMIRGRGHDTRVAYGAKPAIHMAVDFKPDLLISDVAMPDMNGVALAEHFFTTCPECKVILMSGNPSSRALLALASKRGHNYAFLAKPFHPRELFALLTNFEGETSSGSSDTERQ